MVSRRRLFAGAQLKKVRTIHGLRQMDLAELLGISAPYLSQLEHDDRPMTPPLVDRIAKLFPMDWQDFETDSTDLLAIALRDALTDPMFEDVLPPEMLTKLAEQHPAFAQNFVALHEAYRSTSQRLEMVDEAISVDRSSGSRLPWEEVRDWFHIANNYVDHLDRTAEELSLSLCGTKPSPATEALTDHLLAHHKVSVVLEDTRTLREFDGKTLCLKIDAAQPPAAMRFQLAYQVAVLTLGKTINDIAGRAELRSPVARELLKVGLANYAAGAVLMPYESFRHTARDVRHDIDRINSKFGTSFEQTCHRLSTLQRGGARGLPVFFCRVDMAGNITKRHSATRLQFARFGGACPLWIVHEAVAIPDRVLVQLAQTPDGASYVSMAKGLVKPSGSFDRNPRRYAIALGCEIEHAGEFIYADSLDITSEKTATKIGVSCRICSRRQCDQRAYPPSDQEIEVDLHRRGVVPYELKEQIIYINS
jgi:predicted transcriptional regulator/transcriptional regulator with XRE-family HTH domain